MTVGAFSYLGSMSTPIKQIELTESHLLLLEDLYTYVHLHSGQTRIADEWYYRLPRHLSFHKSILEAYAALVQGDRPAADQEVHADVKSDDRELYTLYYLTSPKTGAVLGGVMRKIERDASGETLYISDSLFSELRSYFSNAKHRLFFLCE